MALESLANGLIGLNLSDPEELLFRPRGDKGWLQRTFDDIPRYLYRIFTPKSQGETTASWTKSMDARNASPNSHVDIFARDNERVAKMLSRHLWWKEGDNDNLVSWTNSPLFALVYIFHLHANLRDQTGFDDISFCIIDTTLFKPGTFLRDMELIEVYAPYDTELRKLKKLRRSQFYFGEFLSQGALKIEDECQIVSASAMIKRGLLSLQPDLASFAEWNPTPRPPWAKPVVHLRGNFDQKKTESSIEERLRAVTRIAQLFEPGWRLPMAASLATCLCTSEGLLRPFLSLQFSGMPLLAPGCLR
ncbi:hypothetical protein GQ44DRAFT_633019 [Phaeosphaeriaceae sp. PMI808]|nr:hypothetical protein GQ44DRAFT_633019 [Phaeosphaeriaceae sp. PMI808]